MTIIMPNVMPTTHSGLVDLTEQVAKCMDVLLSDTANFNDDVCQDAVSAAARIQHAAQIADAYLKENDEQTFVVTKSFSDTAWRTRSSAKDLKDSLNFLQKHGTRSYQTLNPWLEGEHGRLLRDGMIELTQATLDVRAPLGENKLAKALFLQNLDGFKKLLGSVWSDSRNPLDHLTGTIYDVLDGGEVPFISLKSGIKAVDDYVRGVTGFGGPSTGPTDEQISENFGVITGFAREIMKQAEARLPQSLVPVKPERQPIFDQVRRDHILRSQGHY